jgi:hypothetical protein
MWFKSSTLVNELKLPGKQRSRGSWFKVGLGKKLMRFHFNQQTGQGGGICNTSWSWEKITEKQLNKKKKKKG